MLAFPIQPTASPVHQRQPTTKNPAQWPGQLHGVNEKRSWRALQIEVEDLGCWSDQP